MARKTRRIRGGFATKYHEYAQMMKHNMPIDIHKFKTFLDSETNPLMQVFAFDKSNNQYTITEWALICNANTAIYDIFCNYNFDLSRRIQYPYHSQFDNSLIEAYVLRSEHIGIINAMIAQLYNEPVFIIENNLLYYWYDGGVIPSLIKILFDMNTILTNAKNKNIIISNIISCYSNTNILTHLTHNYDYVTIAKIFYYATANSCLALMELLLLKLDPINKVKLIFEPEIVDAVLLQNDANIMKWIVIELSRIDENILGSAICKVMKIQKQPCTQEDIRDILETLPDQAYLFFERVGKYAIDNFAMPLLRDRPVIIVVCHGKSLGPEEKPRNFMLRRLCFFANKGHMLCDISPYSRPIQELVCAGHYDSALNCMPSSNNTIMTEDMVFDFNSANYMQEKQDYLGCN